MTSTNQFGIEVLFTFDSASQHVCEMILCPYIVAYYVIVDGY